jgi:hypothetical protein
MFEFTPKINRLKFLQIYFRGETIKGKEKTETAFFYRSISYRISILI